MRVGIYLNDLSPQEGGAHTFEAEILQSLLRSVPDSQHTFVFFSHQPDAPQNYRCPGKFEWVYVKRPARWQRAQQKLRYWWSQVVPNRYRSPAEKTANERLWRVILPQNQIDLLWSFGPYTVCDQVPYIVTVWDLQHRLQPYFPEVANDGQWPYRESHYRPLLQQASYVFVGTQAGKAEVERFYQVPSARVKVLPFPTPGFVLQAASPKPSNHTAIFEKYQLPARYLYYPAQFWPHKNHANLLLAIKQLKDRDQVITPVVFSGSNKGNQAYIESLVQRLGLSAQVKFLGFIPQEDLVALYQNAVALAFVTLFGPDNLPPLEAFALGCPVIASKVSGAEEQLNQAALLVDPLDPGHIASAIKQVWLDEAVRRNLIAQGYARSRLWTGQDYVNQVDAVLDEFQAIRRCWDAGVIYRST